jgi:hypothetical protein
MASTTRLKISEVQEIKSEKVVLEISTDGSMEWKFEEIKKGAWRETREVILNGNWSQALLSMGATLSREPIGL